MNGDRSIKRVTPRWYRRPRLAARVRTAVGVWLLFLTAVLPGSGHAGWAALLVPAAILNFYLAYRGTRALRASGAY